LRRERAAWYYNPNKTYHVQTRGKKAHTKDLPIQEIFPDVTDHSQLP